MTKQEVVILVIMYAFVTIIIIQTWRLWLAQRCIRHLIKQNPTTTRDTVPTKPIIFDHNRSIPNAIDDKVPISIPINIALATMIKLLAIVRLFYQKLKHAVNRNRTEPEKRGY
jgi:hypothetical protein